MRLVILACVLANSGTAKVSRAVCLHMSLLVFLCFPKMLLRCLHMSTCIWSFCCTISSTNGWLSWRPRLRFPLLPIISTLKDNGDREPVVAATSATFFPHGIPQERWEMVATRSHRKVGNMEMMFIPMLEALFRILLGTPIYINLYISSYIT